MEDIFFLYLSSAICFILILILYKYNKSFFVKNITFFSLYSSILYYNLFFNSKWGASLLWLFYLLILNLIHILVIGFYIIRKK